MPIENSAMARYFLVRNETTENTTENVSAREWLRVRADIIGHTRINM
eukprot:COSAG05_NODE_57_length_23291_cov_75.862668_30_plen_47_part_00